MRENSGQPNIFRRAGVALAATITMLGGVGCSAIHAFDENYMPTCPKGVETVTVDEAREAYNNPESNVLNRDDEKLDISPTRKFAKQLTIMDCLNPEGRQVVIRNKAEGRGAIFKTTTTIGG